MSSRFAEKAEILLASHECTYNELSIDKFVSDHVGNQEDAVLG